MTRWSRSRADTMAPERASASASRTWAASSPGLWSLGVAERALGALDVAGSQERRAERELGEPARASSGGGRLLRPGQRTGDVAAGPEEDGLPGEHHRLGAAGLEDAVDERLGARGMSPWCTRSTASASSGWPSRSSLLRSTSRSAAPFRPSPGQSGGMPGAVAVGVGLERRDRRSGAPARGSRSSPRPRRPRAGRRSAGRRRRRRGRRPRPRPASAAGRPAPSPRGAPPAPASPRWSRTAGRCAAACSGAPRSRSTSSPWTCASTSSGAAASAAVDRLGGRGKVARGPGQPRQGDLRPQQIGAGQPSALRWHGRGASPPRRGRARARPGATPCR